MGKNDISRRDLVKVVATGAVTLIAPLQSAEAHSKPLTECPKPPHRPGYIFLNQDEAAFVEALVDHMVPSDKLSPGGIALGINVFIDRALAGSWGKGDRMYLQGPWKHGTPSQGYQLPLTPSELYRSGILAANGVCVTQHKKTFDKLTELQREEFLLALSTGKIEFGSGPFASEFFDVVYQTVMEGMFADPIYGGNRDKAAWKMIGFPGVIETNSLNIIKYRNKKFNSEPLSIADMS